MPTTGRAIVCDDGRPSVDTGGRPIVADSSGSAGCVCEACALFILLQPCAAVDNSPSCDGSPPYSVLWLCASAILDCIDGVPYPGLVIKWGDWCWVVQSFTSDDTFGGTVIDPTEIVSCHDDCTDCCGTPPPDLCCDIPGAVCGFIDGSQIIRCDYVGQAVIESEIWRFCSATGICERYPIAFATSAGNFAFTSTAFRGCEMVFERDSEDSKDCGPGCGGDDTGNSDSWPDRHDVVVRLVLDAEATAAARFPIGEWDDRHREGAWGTAQGFTGPFVSVQVRLLAKTVAAYCGAQSFRSEVIVHMAISLADPSLYFFDAEFVNQHHPEDCNDDGVVNGDISGIGSLNVERCGNQLSIQLLIDREYVCGGTTSNFCDTRHPGWHEIVDFVGTVTFSDAIAECLGNRPHGPSSKYLSKGGVPVTAKAKARAKARATKTTKRTGCGKCGGESLVTGEDADQLRREMQ